MPTPTPTPTPTLPSPRASRSCACSLLSRAAVAPTCRATTKPRSSSAFYVRFETAAAASLCAKDLHGKQFDSLTVHAAFLDPAKFELIEGLPCYKQA